MFLQANAPDDNGVLVGNWSGDYTGGKSPLDWVGSVAIMEQFWKSKEPVQFGQCWVFSGIVTTSEYADIIPATSDFLCLLHFILQNMAEGTEPVFCNFFTLLVSMPHECLLTPKIVGTENSYGVRKNAVRTCKNLNNVVLWMFFERSYLDPAMRGFLEAW